MEYSPDTRTDEAVGGLWPPIFNIAAKAVLYANATCGQPTREEFCHTIDAHPQRRQRKTKCGICDANNPERRHPIENVIDGSAKWWQSPTLASGNQYEFVTITLDLKQVSGFVTFHSYQRPKPGSLPGIRFPFHSPLNFTFVHGLCSPHLLLQIKIFIEF